MSDSDQSDDDVPSGWDAFSKEDMERIREWHSLPVAQRDAYSLASQGLLNGKLEPLAAYIRAGWPIDSGLAEQIADAIEGPDAEGYTLGLTAARGRKLTFDERDDLHRRAFDIALFVRMRRQEHARAGWIGADDEIFAEVKRKFGVGRSTAKKAVSDIRKELGEDVWNYVESSEKPI